jgi:hypothetical protein
MPISWDETRIAALSNPDLLQLRENALRKENVPVGALCEAEISKRGVSVKTARARTGAASSDPLRMMQSDLGAEIGEFASILAQRYDLSPETAKAQSEGHARFVPHKLTQSNGTAKLGGLQRAGKCRIDRYVSYRVKDTVLSLNMFLAKDAADNAVDFQVFGPQEFLPDGQPISKLRPGLEGEKESKLFAWGQRFGRLGEAKAAFEVLVSKVVAKRVN